MFLNYRRCLAVSALLLFSAAVLPAEDPEQKTGRGWKLGPLVGVSWGRAYEIAYDTSGADNRNDYLSLLIWDLMNVPTLGLESRWESGGATALNLSFSSAVPGMPTGEMSDFDWLYTDRDWSHWSLSDINLRWGFVFDLGGDWKVAERGPFALRLGVAYHLDWWAWTDITKDSVYSTTNGTAYPAPFGTYAGDGFRDLPDYLTVGVNGIDYEVAYHSLLFTTSVDLDWDVLFLRIRAGIGPMLALSDDYHKLRFDWGPMGVHFYDTAFGFPWISLGLSVGIHTRGRFSFHLSGTYDWLRESRGNSIAQAPGSGTSYLYPDAAGFSFYKASLYLGGSWDLRGS